MIVAAVTSLRNCMSSFFKLITACTGCWVLWSGQYSHAGTSACDSTRAWTTAHATESRSVDSLPSTTHSAIVDFNCE